jgi:hypothetical protein
MAAKRYYRGSEIPMRGIRRYALQIAEQFPPEKIKRTVARQNAISMGRPTKPLNLQK